MPANLTPDYKAAEAGYRRARDPRERLEWLREMLRTIPKHKGTDHLQADIKSRIKELTEELTGPRKGGARSGPPTVIHPEGAAQVALLGPPNAGKSELHARLTGSRAQVGPWPFTTTFPLPGMLVHEDISFQLVDLPPLAPEHPVSWLPNALQPADGALLVVDLSDPGCVEAVARIHSWLAERRVHLIPDWPADARAVERDDPFALHLPVLLLATKSDLIPDPAGELEVFRSLTGLRYPALAVSAVTAEGLDRIGPWLFEKLGIVRVYTKIPGRAPDMGRPFTVRHGATVHDVATLVHKDMAASLRFARVWGAADIDGRQVGRDHPVFDGEVLELHS